MNQSSRQTLTAPIRRIRFVYVAIFFCFWVGIIGTRLVWLQVVRHHEFVERAARQQQRTFEVAPRRGMLYDRNLRELAMSVLVDSVYAVPSELGENREEAADILAGIVNADGADKFTSREQMLARFNASRNFAWVARKLDPETIARIKELNLKGVYFQKEFKRFYPNNDMAAQVLGYVGTDDTGLGGLERRFDVQLHGTPGHMLTAVDARRRVLGSTEDDPQPGENLVLTIDANIQHMAESVLDEQMDKVKPLHATAVVQDPRTGDILALAVWPRFNPNDTGHIDSSSLTNLAVSDVYEPGSTFKLVTYAAALDAAGVQPEDIVDCQGGKIVLSGRTIHDDSHDMGLGRITVQQALERSSDVGAVKMALKLGPEKFYQYIKGFGFGDRSGIELPAETRGLLQPPRRWGTTSIGSLAIGQEVGVTPVQLVSMVSAIANGGVYMPPHILLEQSDAAKGEAKLQPAAFHPSNQLPVQLPDGSRRVISEMTAAKMRRMMAGIVVNGTGKKAALNGYSAGGKTGTAQKIDVATHTYSKTKHVASFAGMAPVSNPAIAVAIVIDSPSAGASYYGGEVSAPVFRELAQQVLEYLGVPHDQEMKSERNFATTSPEDTGFEDGSSAEGGDLKALFTEVNNLPADDPLRTASALNTAEAEEDEQPPAPVKAAPAPAKGMMALIPAKVLAAFRSGEAQGQIAPVETATNTRLPAPKIAPMAQPGPNGSVIVDAGRHVAVPSFAGEALRQVVEQAAAEGLRVQTVGSGLAREQAPVSGTMVPVGTEIIVRFTR